MITRPPDRFAPSMTELPHISFVSLDSKPNASTIVYFLAEGEGLPPHLKKLDGSAGGAVSRAMEISAFKRKRKSIVEILAPHGIAAGRLMLVGVGELKSLNPREWMEIGGAVRAKLPTKTSEADIVFDGIDSLNGDAPRSFALGFSLKNYAFKKYKSKGTRGNSEDAETENDRVPPRLTIFSSAGQQLARSFQNDEALLQGVYFARDLVNEPSNILTPPEFVERLRALEAEGLKVEALDERALKSLGMNAMLAVGQGSAQPSAAVVLRWSGVPEADSGDGHLVFVGKGVCFDSGGISIKPSQGMEDMKGDMAGAAAVAGLMVALARRKAPVSAIGLVGLVENMPSGTATRPGDVVTSASGQTIEILNTDAEGRTRSRGPPVVCAGASGAETHHHAGDDHRCNSCRTRKGICRPVL